MDPEDFRAHQAFAGNANGDRWASPSELIAPVGEDLSLEERIQGWCWL
jgi:hypothetical protein